MSDLIDSVMDNWPIGLALLFISTILTGDKVRNKRKKASKKKGDSKKGEGSSKSESKIVKVNNPIDEDSDDDE